MRSPVLYVEKTAAFARESDALAHLVAIAEALVPLSRIGDLWTPLNSQQLVLNATTLGLVIAGGRWIHADSVNQPTHVLPIARRPRRAKRQGSSSRSPCRPSRSIRAQTR